MIIGATILVGSITFLVLGLFRSPERPKATDRNRWAAQATLAGMRKDGAGLPSEVGEEANRSEGPPGADATENADLGVAPPSGAD